MLRPLILFISLGISIGANSQNNIKDISTLLNTTHADRTIQLRPFYEQGIRFLDSTTIFSKINAIKDLAHKENDNSLLLETELMEAHYYCYRTYFKKEFVLDKIKSLDKVAKSKNVLWLEIRTQSLLANYLYHNHQNYGRGFEYFERVAQLLENVSAEEFPLKLVCIFQLGQVYSEFKEYEKSNKYVLKARDIKPSSATAYYNPHINNTIGDNYTQLKMLDSSNYYFNLNLEKAKLKKDTIWIGISYGNLGTNALLKKDYNTALPLLINSINIMEKAKDWNFTSGRLTDLGQVYLGINDVEKAEITTIKATKYRDKSNTYSRLLNLYKLKSNLAAHQYKPKLANKYLDSAFIVKDSLDKKFNGTKLLRAQQRIDVEKQRLKEEQLEEENQKKLWLRNLYIIGLVVLILFSILLFNRQQLKNKNKAQRLNSEKELALLKLENARKNLNSFKKSLLDKNKIIADYEENLSTNKISSSPSDASTIKQLENYAILTDKDWRDFVLLFNKAHVGFMERLSTTYPNLTPSETRLMVLSRLELSNKEMALMLGVGESAIRQIKSRFRKKIELEANNTIKGLSAKI